MRLDHLLSKELMFWNGKKNRLEDSFRDIWLCLLAKRDGALGLGMLSGFWSSAPGLIPPTRMVTFSCGCLFGVGVLVVNCIVDASIFDLCKQY